MLRYTVLQSIIAECFWAYEKQKHDQKSIVTTSKILIDILTPNSVQKFFAHDRQVNSRPYFDNYDTIPGNILRSK